MIITTLNLRVWAFTILKITEPYSLKFNIYDIDIPPIEITYHEVNMSDQTTTLLLGLVIKACTATAIHF